MQEKTITITIDEQGNSTLGLNGFAGSECNKPFEDFRGSDAVKLERKKTVYFTNQSNAREQVRR